MQKQLENGFLDSNRFAQIFDQPKRIAIKTETTRFVPLVLMCLVTITSGCSSDSGSNSTGSGTVAPTSSPQNDSKTDRPNLIATELRQKLIGTWLGQASIDRSRLEQVLATLPEDRRADVERLAREFLTTTAALAFDDDGRFEQELEVVPTDGQPVQAGGFGQWLALETDCSQQQVLIEAKTELMDGAKITDRLRFQFAAEGQMRQLIDLGSELAGCSPTIIFQKQTLPADGLAEGAKADLK
jgi:hypothetical protein